MIFNAQQDSNGVTIDTTLYADIPNLSGNHTSSTGIAILHQNKTAYIPNFGKDTALIVKEVGQAFTELSGVDPITGSGAGTTLNPVFKEKLSSLGERIQNLAKELV